ncbi:MULTISPECIES: DUF2971 domain-containing protein [unclassified Halomonas]|uniref:DUF2971 domain-containing protein n=1 Tax=unclassified Halomonas TaxID=2609666 RepID=UPI003FB94835
MSKYITGKPIYRFEPAACSRIESLRDGRLFMADPARFNDPLDLQLYVRYMAQRTGFSEGQLKSAATALFDGIETDHPHWLFSAEMLEDVRRWIKGGRLVTPDHITASLKRHIGTFGVQCFSNSYEIPLSWSHYASGHQGFCIEYDLRKVTLAEENSKLAMYDVTYSNELPQVCVSEILFTPHQVISRLLATKTIDWAYEQEFRLVHFEQKDCKVDMPEGLQIASLIGGANISWAHLELLRSVGQELSVPVYQMVRSEKPGSSKLWDRKRIDGLLKENDYD